jgi:hypothetical protein
MGEVPKTATASWRTRYESKLAGLGTWVKVPKGATHKQLPLPDEIRDPFLCESRSGIRFTTLSNY